MKTRCLKFFSLLFALMLTVMIIPTTEVNAQVSVNQPTLGYINPYSWEKTVETEITETRTIELSGTRVRDLDKLVFADFKVIQPYGGYGYYRLYKNGELYKEFTEEDLYEGDIEIEAGVTYTIYPGTFISRTKIVFTEEPVAVQYDVTYSVHVQDKMGTYYTDGVYHVNGEGFTFGILVPQGYNYRNVWADDMLTTVITRNWGKDYDQNGYHYESYTVTGEAYKDIQITYEYYSTTGPDFYTSYASVENDDSDDVTDGLLTLVPDEGRGGDCPCPSYEAIEKKFGSELAEHIYNEMRSGKYPEVCNCGENCQCEHEEKPEVIPDDEEDEVSEEIIEEEPAEEDTQDETSAEQVSENTGTEEVPAETAVENTAVETPSEVVTE